MQHNLSISPRNVYLASPTQHGDTEWGQDVARELSSSIRDSSACGARARWARWNLVCRALYRAWRYRLKIERQEIRFLRRTIRPGQTVVDIGAHKGAFTYWMHRSVGRSGQVIAFEPQAELADYLVRVSRALGIDKVAVVSCALSSRSGTTTLVRPVGHPSPGAAITSRKGQNEEIVSVQVNTLDDFFLEHPRRPIHFIKCDVEGHEHDVFRGGVRILREDRPILLFECERRHHPQRQIDHVFRLLEGLGYEGYFFSGPRGVLRPLCDLGEAQLNNPESKRYTRNFVFLPR